MDYITGIAHRGACTTATNGCVTGLSCIGTIDKTCLCANEGSDYWDGDSCETSLLSYLTFT